MLNNETKCLVEDRLALHLTYPLLRGFQKVLNDTHILLTPNDEHKTSFGEKSHMTGQYKSSTLKDFPVRTKVTKRYTKKSKGASCDGKSCQVCQSIEETGKFEGNDCNK